MTHYVGGIERTPSGPDWAPLAPPPGVTIVQLAAEQGLDRMLESGDIDALFTAHVPPSARRFPDRVRRLFADVEDVERDYFRRTRIFPIMHTVVIRREVYERDRWIARALLNAFERAKTLAMTAYDAADIFFNAPSMVPWFASLREKNRALMGEDFWPYGVAENKNAIETCLRYHREQGILKRSYRIEDLFAPETLN
jgi:4,5-dihydroxyphthalate decarboxylase